MDKHKRKSAYGVLSFRQYLTANGVDISDAMTIYKQRNQELHTFREQVIKDELVNQTQSKFCQLIQSSSLNAQSKAYVIQQFQDDLDQVRISAQKVLFSQLDRDNAPAAWEAHGYESAAAFADEVNALNWQNSEEMRLIERLMEEKSRFPIQQEKEAYLYMAQSDSESEGNDREFIRSSATAKNSHLVAADWETYKTSFLETRSRRYPGVETEPDAYVLLHGVAETALRAGESQESVRAMLETSPDNQFNWGGDKLTHAQTITTQASQKIERMNEQIKFASQRSIKDKDVDMSLF